MQLNYYDMCNIFIFKCIYDHPIKNANKRELASSCAENRYIVELEWLEQAWDRENWFQSKEVPASKGRFLYL